MKSKLLTLIFAVLLFSQPLFSQAGTPDKSFGKNGIAKIYVPLDIGGYIAYPSQLVQRKDGKYLVVIYVGISNTNRHAYLYLLTNKGKVDSAFGTNGRISLYTGDESCTITNLALDTAGNILITSALTNFLYDRFTIIRLKPGGNPDLSFGDSGMINLQKGTFLQPELGSLNILPNGSFLLAAGFNDNPHQGSILYKFTFSGKPDSGFNGKGSLQISDASSSNRPVALQSNGKFLFGQLKIHSFYDDGTVNNHFGVHGTINGDSHNGHFETFSNLQTINGDKFMCTGNLQIPGNNGVITNTDKIYRFTKNGEPDSSFNSTGVLVIDSNITTDLQPVYLLTVQSDLKFLVDSASFDTFNDHELITRYNKNGTVDKAFGTNGRIHLPDLISEIYLDKDSKIVFPFLNFEQFPKHPDTVYIQRFKNNVITTKPSSLPENVIAKNYSSINISPNPVQSTLHITGLKSNTKLSIVNESGKTVAETSVSSNNYNWNIQHLPVGNYFLVASQNNQLITSIKFIKQ